MEEKSETMSVGVDEITSSNSLPNGIGDKEGKLNSENMISNDTTSTDMSSGQRISLRRRNSRTQMRSRSASKASDDTGVSRNVKSGLESMEVDEKTDKIATEKGETSLDNNAIHESQEEDDEGDFLGFERIEDNYSPFSLIMEQYNQPSSANENSIGNSNEVNPVHGLTLDNFTFWKEPLGIGDPTKEIIRDAKIKSKMSEDTSISPVKKTVLRGKNSTQGKSVSPSSASENSKPPTPLTPKIVFKTNIKKANSKKNIVKDKKRKSAGPDDSKVDMDELAEWSPQPKAQRTREVCSIECRLAMGLIPTLQCVTCLCLYHPECVSLPQAKYRHIHSYVCKSCQNAKLSQTKPSVTNLPPPPPLTPIVPSNTSPPKKEKEPKSGGALRTQPIVGAVTTWLPPTSSIQVGKGPASLAPRPMLDSNPQSLITVQGKKFILIPKHNVVKLDSLAGDGDSLVLPPTQPANSPGVLLVPYSTTPSSTPGTFVVQTSTNSAPTYIVTSPQNATQITSSTTQLANSMKRGTSETSEGSPPEKTTKVVSSVTTKQSATAAKAVPAPATKVSAKKLQAPVPVNPPSTFASSNFVMMNITAGFTALLHSFRYLKVHELLRATCVSMMWRSIATHPSLWEVVKMKNSRVRDWSGFGRALRNNRTKALDLKKMLLPESADATLEMWTNLAEALKTVPTLKKIDLGRCIPESLELFTKACPQLESIVSLTIRGQSLDLNCFKYVPNLQELRIKSVGGFDVTNFKGLKGLSELKHLAITTAKNLEGIEEVLSESLETLELGECGSLREELATEALPKLKNLKRLRLEKGQGSTCPTTQIIAAVANLENLKQLELINFDIKPGFDKVLAKCIHLRTLLIIPTYVTQSATTNHVVMGGVSKLSGTLTYFIWGLTLELLRVTDLFIDQVEAQKSKSMASKKGSGDSIPILKPLSDETIESSKEGQTTSQVDILALPKLQKVLSTLLPTTKIKILKVPFSATWRQTVDI